MEEEDYLWILGSPMRTSKTENQDVSTVIYMDIWQETAKSWRRRKTSESATNIKK